MSLLTLLEKCTMLWKCPWMEIMVGHTQILMRITKVVISIWSKYIPNGVVWICDPLRMYSLSEMGVMRSSSNKSCHTYPLLYLLPFN